MALFNVFIRKFAIKNIIFFCFYLLPGESVLLVFWRLNCAEICVCQVPKPMCSGLHNLKKKREENQTTICTTLTKERANTCMNAYKMNSTLLCLVIKPVPFIFFFCFICWFIVQQKSARILVLCSFLSSQFSMLHRVFFFAVLIFLFSLCTDNISDVEMNAWVFVHCTFAQCEAAAAFVLLLYTPYTIAHDDMNARNKWTHVLERKQTNKWMNEKKWCEKEKQNSSYKKH